MAAILTLSRMPFQATSMIASLFPQFARNGFKAIPVDSTGELQLDGLLQIAEVPLDELGAEEVMGAVAPPRQQLRRELEPDQAVRSQAEAGVALGEVVEATNPGGGEHAEQPKAEGVDDEETWQLLAVAARSLGVGTAADLADYFRIRVPEARPRIHELVEEGVIRPVAVEGWRQPAYLHQDARLPRRVARSALLSPFDSLVWFRDRVHRLFGFHYRIEIYVPAHLRTHGYYVLPFLHDERIPARVDLKAERKEGLLRVQSAHLEPGEPAEEVAEALSRELRALSGWLGLGGNVRVVRRGNLALSLAAALTDEA